MSRSVLSGGRRRGSLPRVARRRRALTGVAVMLGVLAAGLAGGEQALAPAPSAQELAAAGRGSGAAGGGTGAGGGSGGAIARLSPAQRDAAARAARAARRRSARRRAERAEQRRAAALAVRLDVRRDPVRLRFRHQPRAGLMFDLDTGAVLWRKQARRVLPVASLTKLMTALLVVERLPPGTRVPITPETLRYRGSGVGLFRLGRRIPVETMLHGLLLASGNDAAIALAQRAAGGSMRRFVLLMNERARELNLRCTRFARPDGYQDEGNHSCAADMAALSRAVLRKPRLARIVRRRAAVLPFPTRGGRLFLSNHNPLLRVRYPGTTGLKTGWTRAAGRCLVATARRRGRRLGVVLLASPDPGAQAVRLLDRGWSANR